MSLVSSSARMRRINLRIRIIRGITPIPWFLIISLVLLSCGKPRESGPISGTNSGRDVRSDPKQQEARKQLDQQGIPYTKLAFLEFIRSGDVAVAKLFLEAGMNPDVYYEAQWTPLMYAASNGHLDMVNLLLGNGVTVNAQDQFGVTALIHAIQDGFHRDVIKTLLENGADPNAKLRDGRTALILAVHDPDIVRALLEKRADPSPSEEIRAETALKRAVNADEIDSVKALLSYGADVNTMDVDGYSALMQAAGTGQTGIVKLLLSKGVDVNARDKDGWTALMGAASIGNIGIVRALLAKGADANAKDRNGRTPFTLAREKGHKKIVQLLRKT